MQSFKLAIFLSILAASEAAVKVVTDVTIETVYVNPASESSYESSSYEYSAYNSSSYESSDSVSTSSEEPYTYVTAEVITTLVPNTLIPTTSIPTAFTPATSVPVVTSPNNPVPTTLLTKVSSSSSTPAAQPTTATGSSSGSGSGDNSFASAILNAHNEKRAAHNVAPLTWDDKLYQYAANYAQSYSCSGGLTHSGGPYGENLALGYADGPSAVEAWYDEGANYDYSSATTFDHFTQVIWKSTTKLGCAYKDCSAENWGKYVICSYDPAGNFIGQGKANILN